MDDYDVDPYGQSSVRAQQQQQVAAAQHRSRSTTRLNRYDQGDSQFMPIRDRSLDRQGMVSQQHRQQHGTFFSILVTIQKAINVNGLSPRFITFVINL